MNPDLSGRAARAFQHASITGMDPRERGSLADRIEAAAAFEDLPRADRDLIEAAERHPSARGAQG